MPMEGWPRSLAFLMTKSGASCAPTLATGTFCPLATLGAPQTMGSGSPSPTSHLAHRELVGLGVGLAFEHVAHDHVVQVREGVDDLFEFQPEHGQFVAQFLVGAPRRARIPSASSDSAAWWYGLRRPLCAVARYVARVHERGGKGEPFFAGKSGSPFPPPAPAPGPRKRGRGAGGGGGRRRPGAKSFCIPSIAPVFNRRSGRGRGLGGDGRRPERWGSRMQGAASGPGAARGCARGGGCPSLRGGSGAQGDRAQGVVGLLERGDRHLACERAAVAFRPRSGGQHGVDCGGCAQKDPCSGLAVCRLHLTALAGHCATAPAPRRGIPAMSSGASPAVDEPSPPQLVMRQPLREAAPIENGKFPRLPKSVLTFTPRSSRYSFPARNSA